MDKRTFSALWGHEQPIPVDIRPAGDLWVVSVAGRPTGLLATPAYGGPRTKHPDYPDARVLLGTTLTGDRWSEAQLHQIKETTPGADDLAYRQLLGCIRTFLGSGYCDGHITEREAWNQAVLMPQAMAGLTVSVPDLRRALTECGWIRFDPIRKLWRQS